MVKYMCSISYAIVRDMLTLIITKSSGFVASRTLNNHKHEVRNPAVILMQRKFNGEIDIPMFQILIKHSLIYL